MKPLELLTGIDAGVADDQGKYPLESFNGQVEAQLLQFTSIRKDFNNKSDN